VRAFRRSHLSSRVRTTDPLSFAVLPVAVVGVGLTMIGVAFVAAIGQRPSEVVLLIAAAFVPYAGILTAPPASFPARSLALAGLVAALVGVVMIAAPPVLSDDIYRYVWDGRVLTHGIDPYRFAPDAPELAHLRDALWRKVNNPELPTIYPPLAQALFALCDGLHHGPLMLKLLSLVVHLATIPLVARIAGADGSRASLAYALNPLALAETALSGHIDIVAGALVAACVAALLARRPWPAAFLAACASGVKLIGLAVAPLVARRSRLAAVLAVVLALAPLWPLARAGEQSGADASGLAAYATRWGGNAGPHLIVYAVARGIVAIAAPLTGAPEGMIDLKIARPLLERARAATRKEKSAPTRRDRFPTELAASALARLMSFALVIALAMWLVRRKADPLRAARWVVLSALLLSPQVHPWYLLWLLPIEIASLHMAGVVWSAAVLVAYVPLDRWVIGRQWIELPLAVVAEYALVLAVVALEGQELVRSRLVARS